VVLLGLKAVKIGKNGAFQPAAEQAGFSAFCLWNLLQALPAGRNTFSVGGRSSTVQMGSF
jgi:hypothetical protein